MGLDVSQHLRVDRGSESGNWIPSLSGVESLATRRASSFGTDVVSVGDIGEGSRVSGSHLVQERGDETEGLSGLGVDVVVKEGDDSGEDRGRSGSSSNRFDGSTGHDEYLRTKSSNIRETSSVRVVVAGRREGNTGLEVSGNGSTLVDGLGSDVRETTSRGEVGLSEADALFGTGRSTVKSRAARRRVREVSLSGGGGDLGGSDGGDVRGGGREDRVKVVLGARWISTSVGTRISGSTDESDTTETNLLEFRVDTLNVLGVVESHLLALSTSDTVLALGFLIPSVGDGVYERNVLGAEHVAGESVQPNVILFDPEPSLGTGGNSEDILDIEGSFDLRVGRHVVTNDVVSGKRRDRDGERGGEVGEIGRREILILEFDDTSGGVSSDLSTSSLVDGLDGLRGDGDQSFRSKVLLVSKTRNRELTESSNELNVFTGRVRSREGTKLTNNLTSRLNVLEHTELSVEQLGGSLDGSLGVDGITLVLQVFSTTINQPSHNGLLDLDGRSDDGSDFFDGHKVTVVGAVRVGNIPEEGFKLLQVLLVESDDEGELVGRLSRTQMLPGGRGVFECSCTEHFLVGQGEGQEAE